MTSSSLYDPPPCYEDAVRGVGGSGLGTTINISLPGCTGFVDADPWGLPTPVARHFDFKLRMTAASLALVVKDDPVASIDYNEVNTLIARSLRDATRAQTAGTGPERPWHLNAYAWHSRLVYLMGARWPQIQRLGMESTFPISRGAADAKVTYASEVLFHHPPEQSTASNIQYQHDASMTITDIRALASFCVRDTYGCNMRQAVGISLKLNLNLPADRWALHQSLPGGPHELTESEVRKINEHRHPWTVNRLADEVRKIVRSELSQHSRRLEELPPLGHIFREGELPPQPYCVGFPARLVSIVLEVPDQHDKSTTSAEMHEDPDETQPRPPPPLLSVGPEIRPPSMD